MPRRLLDALFTAIALILLIPTFLILISWNAIPGDGLYPLKTGLEDVTLLLLSGTPLVPKVSASFTDRRFNEATKLLNTKSTAVGYDLLVAEASQTQALVTSKNDSATAAIFVQNIDKYQQQILQKRVEIAASIKSGPANMPTPFPTQTPVQSPTSAVSTAGPSGQVTQQIFVTQPTTIVVSQESPEKILQTLDNTNQQLEEIKQKVKKDLPENSNKPEAPPGQQKKGD